MKGSSITKLAMDFQSAHVRTSTWKACTFYIYFIYLVGQSYAIHWSENRGKHTNALCTICMLTKSSHRRSDRTERPSICTPFPVLPGLDWTFELSSSLLIYLRSRIARISPVFTAAILWREENSFCDKKKELIQSTKIFVQGPGIEIQ